MIDVVVAAAAAAAVSGAGRPGEGRGMGVIWSWSAEEERRGGLEERGLLVGSGWGWGEVASGVMVLLLLFPVVDSRGTESELKVRALQVGQISASGSGAVASTVGDVAAVEMGSTVGDVAAVEAGSTVGDVAADDVGSRTEVDAVVASLAVV